MTQMATASVIIPFFQRERGLLERAIHSVLLQEGSLAFAIVVVDDGSPVSAKDEVRASGIADDRLTIIRQPNAGPGAARNRGLDSVPAGTRYIAFLDSDDRWEASFLGDAVAALDKGYDLFFGNSRRFGIEKTRFEWSPSPELNLDQAKHKLVDADRQLYEFAGDFFDFTIYRSNIISTSVMMYRYEKFPTLRFSEKLFNGQDRLFKLALCQSIGKVAFSPKVHADEGRGVNIFDSSGWGTDRSIALAANYIKLSRAILAEISLRPEQRKHIVAQLNRSRHAFAASFLHLLRTRGKIDPDVLLKTFQADPQTAIRLLPNAARIVFEKIARAAR
jgi:succinoglycan biosynthesis protein ExoW